MIFFFSPVKNSTENGHSLSNLQHVASQLLQNYNSQLALCMLRVVVLHQL